jgi:hypothetical protein
MGVRDCTHPYWASVDISWRSSESDTGLKGFTKLNISKQPKTKKYIIKTTINMRTTY